MMTEDETDSWRVCLIMVLLLIITGTAVVAGDSLDTDRDVLMNLKTFLEQGNQVNRGRYSQWNKFGSNPCNWDGVFCSLDGTRVTGLDLTDNNISGKIFSNFSALTQLSHLDLSKNTLYGSIPDDFTTCHNLVYLNLSHNILEGELNLTGLYSLEVLDLSVNRIGGDIGLSFPAICSRLIVANISNNNLNGSISNGTFDGCLNLQYLDISSNSLSGGLWNGFARLKELSVAENHQLGGEISDLFFSVDTCNLEVLDLSENSFVGSVPGSISNCRNLVILNLSRNKFTGQIPSQLGSVTSLEALFLGSNNFSRDLPESLLNLTKLTFLDLSNNTYGGDIQDIIGRFTNVKFLVLNGNSYTGGIDSSGILKLPNVSRLDLSYNNFSGSLPVEFSQMLSLKFLILAYNQFNATIPSEFGNLQNLQALDLSFNRLSGFIPSSLGKLDSLLWLMLADNLLTGNIPRELGNCSSLLWLNLSNNKLSGTIPPELMNIGRNATATFMSNRQDDKMILGGSDCLEMTRWIPADYPPFSFVYTILTTKKCRSLWDQLLKGTGIFPVCAPESSVRTFEISGYLLLSGNRLSGKVPVELGNLKNFSMLHLGFNEMYGEIPPEIAQVRLVVFNVTQNKFSGEIPTELGTLKCLLNLDLSYNNFSGAFPASLNNLTDLSKFNVSYNPLISGVIPTTGQLATFEKESYLGDPFLVLPEFIRNSTNNTTGKTKSGGRDGKHTMWTSFLVSLTLTFIFLTFGVLAIIGFMYVKSPAETAGYLLEEAKYSQAFAASSSGSSPWLSDAVKVIRLDKTAFTHADILKATGNFSHSRVIGRGGSGTVYRGVLPDGREVAVKKLQREGTEGEKEFRAEMEVLSGKGFGWPHPNLVTLYGWCLDGSEKILVYEYMEGGSLEDLVPDRLRLTWKRRIDIVIDVAKALVFLHHECYPAIVHRDVKANNVLLDEDGKARVTDFGLARVVGAGNSHVSTMVAGTVGYVAPEYGQTWKATTKGDVYSYGVLVMELATGRRAVDGAEECLVEWGRRVMGYGHGQRTMIPVVVLGSGLAEGAEEMCELLRIGVRCTAEAPQARPNMKEVLAMLIKITTSSRGNSLSRNE
ncbi:Leucine-rich repeat protein kinase family protein [Tripterygium wilfordii]|uniref:non-specific serine/threonine protein kinase n=1 Tax=Tripterygium wilfordii TaxID=458696 RepID=A0A7J7C7R4_TRIWF|nr:probable LRR receptor-like serine/threonine-protein kinase At1g74360 [Tripterygium wilfordii]KAF5730178.1 Leucine-rich repeat protein kinase family protein [Tripterygium wilfordii]